MMKPILLSSFLALSLAGCATAVPPVEVTRFHVDNPARSGTIAVEEMLGNPDAGLEFRTYAAAVDQELQRVGFAPAEYSALQACVFGKVGQGSVEANVFRSLVRRCVL